MGEPPFYWALGVFEGAKKWGRLFAGRGWTRTLPRCREIERLRIEQRALAG